MPYVKLNGWLFAMFRDHCGNLIYFLRKWMSIHSLIWMLYFKLIMIFNYNLLSWYLLETEECAAVVLLLASLNSKKITSSVLPHCQWWLWVVQMSDWGIVLADAMFCDKVTVFSLSYPCVWGYIIFLCALVGLWREDYWSSTAVGLSSCSGSGSRGLTTCQTLSDPGQWGPGLMLWSGLLDSHLEGSDGGWKEERKRCKSLAKKATWVRFIGGFQKNLWNAHEQLVR